MRKILVEHETQYQYQTEVELAHHLAYLSPLESDWQKVISSDLSITPQPDNQSESLDYFSNKQTFFTLSTPHRALIVKAVSVVEIQDRYGGLGFNHSPQWENVRDALGYSSDCPYLEPSEFCYPSPYVPRLSELRQYALQSFLPGRGIAEASLDLSTRINQDFKYSSEATEVHTPILDAFRKRAGVCQDFSHILIGCLRAIGLSAQYVSGYLMTRPAPGKAKLRGADASHAWVSVYCPGMPGQWLELDPTNNMVVGLDHVRVAIGRDFGDVSPLRGIIRGGGDHSLQIAVTTEVLAA